MTLAKLFHAEMTLAKMFHAEMLYSLGETCKCNTYLEKNGSSLQLIVPSTQQKMPWYSTSTPTSAKISGWWSVRLSISDSSRSTSVLAFPFSSTIHIWIGRTDDFELHFWKFEVNNSCPAKKEHNNRTYNCIFYQKSQRNCLILIQKYFELTKIFHTEGRPFRKSDTQYLVWLYWNEIQQKSK